MKDKDAILLEKAYQLISENHNLFQRDIEVDGKNYDVFYKLEGKTPFIYQIFPRIEETEEPAVFDIKDPNKNREDKLNELGQKIYLQVKEKLAEEYGSDDEYEPYEGEI